jgi:predicted Zn-dependent peptidase
LFNDPIHAKTTLKNGIRVVTETHPHFKSASVGFFVHRGSRDEAKGHEGISHLIEHMVFKGTKSRTAMQIAESLECVGGDLNAFTSKEQTCFHGLALQKDLPKIMSVLSDLLVNGTFAEADLKLEKSVVVSEIQMSADQLEDYIFDIFFEEFYKKSPMQHPILGTEKSLAKIKRKDLVDYYKKNYAGSQVVIAGTGPFSHEEFLKECETHLGSLPPFKGPEPKRVAAKPNAFTKMVSRPSEQTHILIGIPCIDFTHKHKTTGIVANLALGAGMTSHLYQKIREEKGLAYTVFSALQMFLDTGILFLYAGTSAENLEEVLSSLAVETKKFFSKKMSDEKLEFFKNQMVGQLVIASDDVENRMLSIGTNEQLLGKYRGVAEVIREVEQISQSVLLDFYKNGLDFTKASAVVVGDLEGKRKKVEKLIDKQIEVLRGMK